MTAYCYMRMCALDRWCAQAASICATSERAMCSSVGRGCIQCSYVYAAMLMRRTRACTCGAPVSVPAAYAARSTSRVHVSARKPQTSACQSTECSHELRTSRRMATTVRDTTRTYLESNRLNI
eukprot:637692-Pleurochrysis_carterae.AAC.1